MKKTFTIFWISITLTLSSYADESPVASVEVGKLFEPFQKALLSMSIPDIRSARDFELPVGIVLHSYKIDGQYLLDVCVEKMTGNVTALFLLPSASRPPPTKQDIVSMNVSRFQINKNRSIDISIIPQKAVGKN